MDPEETVDVSTRISLSESSSNEQNELPVLKDPCDLVDLASYLSLDALEEQLDEESKTLAECEGGESLTATWTLLDNDAESPNELGTEIPQTEQLKSDNADVNLEDPNDLSDSKLSSAEDPGSDEIVQLSRQNHESNKVIVNQEDLEQIPSVPQESLCEQLDDIIYDLSDDESSIVVDAFIVSPNLSEEKVCASSKEESEAHITKRKSQTSDSDAYTEIPQSTLKKCRVEEDVKGELITDSQFLRMQERVEEFQAAYLKAKKGIQPDRYKFQMTSIEQESKTIPKNGQEKLNSMQVTTDGFIDRVIKESSLREPTLRNVGGRTDKYTRIQLPTSSSLEEPTDSVQGENVNRANTSSFQTSEDYISGNKCITLLAWEKPNSSLYDLVCIDRDKLRNEGFDLPRLPIVGRIKDVKAMDVIKYVNKDNLIEKLNADIQARNSNEQADVDARQNDSSSLRTPDERVTAVAEVLASMKVKNNLSKDGISNTEVREHEIDQTHLSTEPLQESAVDPPPLPETQSTVSRNKSVFEFGGVFNTLKKLLVFCCFTVIIVFVIIISRLTGINLIVPRKEMRDSRKPPKSPAKERVSQLQKGAKEL